MLARVAVFTILGLFLGCGPEVGSKEWCEQMKDKPKTDWSSDEVKSFAKKCILASPR